MRGEFKASCHLSRDVLVTDAIPEWLEAADSDIAGKGRWINGLGRAIPVQCDFTTDEPTLFDDHMSEVHGRKLGTVCVRTDPRNCRELPSYAWRPPTPAWVRDAGKPWKAPRATKQLFVPKPLEPGAQVTWTQYVAGPAHFDAECGREIRHYSIARTGQVWSLGYGDKSFWVVPEKPWRDELAVLLKPNRLGSRLEITGTYPRKAPAEVRPAA